MLSSDGPESLSVLINQYSCWSTENWSVKGAEKRGEVKRGEEWREEKKERRGKERRGDRRSMESRRPIVPIIDILCLGKHRPLKLSQKHTLPKSKDKGPLSRRCACVCVCIVCACWGSSIPHFLCSCTQVCVLNYPIEKKMGWRQRGRGELSNSQREKR